MAFHCPLPPRQILVSIGSCLVAVGCVGASEAVDIPGATTPPVTVERVDDVADTTLTSTSLVPVTEPPAATPLTTTAPAVTEPTAIEPTTTVLAPTTTLAPPPDRFLRIGDEGDEVSLMQSKLQILEYLEPGYTDGLFDRATADAVIDFQAQYGLVVDGIFGPQTARSLNAAAASVDSEN